MPFLQQPMVVAIQRALLGAALTFGASFMTAYYVQHTSTAVAAGVAGAAAFAYLVARIGGEGMYDQATKPNQNVPTPTPMPAPTPSPIPLAPGTSVRLGESKPKKR